MPLKSGLDLLLALLYAPGGSGQPGESVRGVTRVEKLVFLALEEGGFKDEAKEYKYQAYDIGPYSKEVVDYLTALRGAGLLDVREERFESFKEVIDEVMVMGEVPPEEKTGKVEIYALSEKGRRVGRKVFERLAPEEQQRVEQLKRQFNQMDLDALLKYVYKKYPSMTVKSKVLDQILGVGARTGLKGKAD